MSARLTAFRDDVSNSSPAKQTEQADEETLLHGLIVQILMPTVHHVAQHPQNSQHDAKFACSLLMAMTNCTPSCLQGKLTESLIKHGKHHLHSPPVTLSLHPMLKAFASLLWLCPQNAVSSSLYAVQ